MTTGPDKDKIMATMSEEPGGFMCKEEPVCHVETAAFDAPTLANHEETRQQIKPELDQETQNSDENRIQDEDNNEERRIVVKYEIHPDVSTICTGNSGEANSGNCDSSEQVTDVNMDIENSVSEEIQVESESICEIGKVWKLEDRCDAAEINGEDSSINYDGDQSSLPENINCNNEEQSSACQTVADFAYTTVDENTDFVWEKLFIPPQTKFPYPEDEREIEKLAEALWQKRFRLLGRDLHDIITMCNFASQWKTISEESKNYVYQRMMLLYLAVTRGWRYALAASDPDSGYSHRRLVTERSRGGYKPRKKRRLALIYYGPERPTQIESQQTDQVISTQQ